MRDLRCLVGRHRWHTAMLTGIIHCLRCPKVRKSPVQSTPTDAGERP